MRHGEVGQREGELYQYLLTTLAAPTRDFYSQRFSSQFVPLGRDFGVNVFNQRYQFRQGERTLPCIVERVVDPRSHAEVYQPVLAQDSLYDGLLIFGRIESNKFRRILAFTRIVEQAWIVQDAQPAAA